MFFPALVLKGFSFSCFPRSYFDPDAYSSWRRRESGKVTVVVEVSVEDRAVMLTAGNLGDRFAAEEEIVRILWIRMVTALRDSSRTANKRTKRRKILIRSGLPGEKEFLCSGVAVFLPTAAILQPISGKHGLPWLPATRNMRLVRAGVESQSISVHACKVFPRRESRPGGGFRARGAGRW